VTPFPPGPDHEPARQGGAGPSAYFEVMTEGLDHPEGVAWGRDGFVYAGGEAGQIYRAALDGSVAQVATTGGFILGVCPDGDGNVFACDTGRREVVRASVSGDVSAYFAGLPDRRLVNPNYAVFDSSGNLYLSDSGEYHKDNGCLWKIAPGGRGEVLRDDVRAFPNGLALSADEAWLYVAVSTLPGVVRAPLAGGAVETVTVLDRKVPDGLAFDIDGNLYISCYSPDEIWRLRPSGTLELFAEDWERAVLAAPTNMAFCGPALDIMVVANLGRWHLAKARVEVPGLASHYPRGVTG
jgi:sugar lactone lactonase YvrE